MKNEIAFVVFAKTPGKTPAKTRLAGDIGIKQSEAFYLACCEELKKDLERLDSSKDVSVYISVAEKEGEGDYWDTFNVFNQPEGGLGEKLHATYDQIKLNHNFERVIFLGVDSPQLGFEDYIKWIDHVRDNEETLLGPAMDGGFYVFSPFEVVDRNFWLSIKYSDATTCAQLIRQLDKRKMKYKLLKKEFDVDYKSDLVLLKSELSKKQNEGFKTELFDYLKKINT